jgi:penicillin-binding protein 1A
MHHPQGYDPEIDVRRDRRAGAVRIAQFILLGLAVLFLIGFTWVWYAPCWLGGCAPVHELAEYQAEGSEILDMNGERFATLATVNRRVVSLDTLPEHVPQAFLAIEDRRFYRHDGVDLRRVMGAGMQNIRAGGVAEGGSTITMQLARNLFPDQLPFAERTMRRKVVEMRVARQIERSFSKDKILELYINHIYLGAGAHGVDAASRVYFGKSAADLEIHEAAALAAVPQAPSRTNPRDGPERTRERRNVVLRRMAAAGHITEAEAAEMQELPLEVAEADEPEETHDSGYFVERVRRELQERMGDLYYTAGLRVHTTLDASAQRAAEEELEGQLRSTENGGFGAYRHTTFEAARGDSEAEGTSPYLQGMVVTLDTETGAVRALVGGRDFDDSKFDRAVQSQRQSGSAFKPFVFLTALSGRTPPTRQIEDAPVQIQLTGTRTWSPRNYGGQYDGMMTLREALARSKNVVTVKLAQDVGIGQVSRTAQQLGITTDIPQTPATALGAADVRPIEMVRAYAAFSNGGYRVEPYFITRVEDRRGRVLWENEPQRSQVADPAATYVLTQMLRDVVERGTGTGVRGAGFRGAAAGKTGTTNRSTDVWFIGYTPDLVTGVWIGLDDPQPIVGGATGGRLAAPVWGRIMNRVYQNRTAPGEWSRPSGVSTAQVDRATGAIVSDGCPPRGEVYTEYFVGNPPAATCPRGDFYLARGDTIWGDEEWGAGDDWAWDDDFDWGADGAEERERRGVYVEDRERETAEPEPVEPVEPEPEPEPEPDPPAREEPELLGEPVQRPPPDGESPDGDGNDDEEDADGD